MFLWTKKKKKCKRQVFSSSSCEPQSRHKSSVHALSPSTSSGFRPELTCAGKSPANIPLCCSSFHIERTTLCESICAAATSYHVFTPKPSQCDPGREYTNIFDTLGFQF